MKAEIIAIGSELLSGILDTNSSFLAERLLALGIDLRSMIIVPDREEGIRDAVKRAIDRSDLILITGGLGPTDDDLTRKIVAKTLGIRLVLRGEIIDKIKAYFREREIEMPKINERQALIPFGAKTIENPIGTAPGFLLEYQDKLIICLPGPYNEMRTMFFSIEPALKERCGEGLKRLKVLRTCGLHESTLNDLLKEMMDSCGRDGLEIGLIASETGIDIRITCLPTAPLCVSDKTGHEQEAILNALEERIKERLGDYIYGSGKESLEEVIGRLLKERGLKISVAESCTGGLIAHRITNVPGSSKYFERGLILYSNDSKKEILNIPSKILEKHGSVSPEGAVAMAEGVRSLSRTDLGLSATGIAGPTGELKGKPIGLVYIALASPEETGCKGYRFISDREGIKAQATQMALDMVRRYLLYYKR